MADAYTLTDARSRLGELVNRARFGHERIILSEHGMPVAAIISVEELAELQAAADAADIAAALAAKARSGPGIPHEQAMALFDAMDEADQASSPEEAAKILAPHAALIARLDAYELAMKQ